MCCLKESVWCVERLDMCFVQSQYKGDHRGGGRRPPSLCALNKGHVLALITAHVLRPNKADVLALNKARVLRVNFKTRPVVPPHPPATIPKPQPPNTCQYSLRKQVRTWPIPAQGPTAGPGPRAAAPYPRTAALGPGVALAPWPGLGPLRA